MLGDLSEGFGVLGFLGQGGHGLDDDVFGSFDDVQGFVVLSLFFSPFLVSQRFVGVQLVDFLSNQVSEFEFSVSLGLFLVSSIKYFSMRCLYLMGIFSPNSLVNSSILCWAAAISASKLAKSASHSSWMTQIWLSSSD